MAQDVWKGRADSDRDIVGTRPRRPRSGVGRRWMRAAETGVCGALEAGREAYDRQRTLPRLIALDPRELDPGDPALDRSIVARLKRALRAERRRGQAGHWTYDLDRHLALLQALACEEGRAGATSGARPSIGPIPSGPGRPPETNNAARSAGRRC